MYMCIYIYTYREREMYMYVYIYIHNCLCILNDSKSETAKRSEKGQMGSALMVSLQISYLLTEGPFGCSRKPTFIFPKVPGRTVFPNLSKLMTFAVAPLVLTPFLRNPRKQTKDQGDRYYSIVYYIIVYYIVC